MKHKVDLNIPILSHRNEPVLAEDTREPVAFGDVIANYLAMSEDRQNYMKCFLWAQDLAQKKALVLDKVDFALFKQKVTEAHLNNTMRVRINEVLDTCETCE